MGQYNQTSLFCGKNILKVGFLVKKITSTDPMIRSVAERRSVLWLKTLLGLDTCCLGHGWVGYPVVGWRGGSFEVGCIFNIHEI